LSQLATAQEALDLPLTDCAKLVREGKVSPVTLTEASLESARELSRRTCGGTIAAVCMASRMA
jgi:hypothetical protein